MADETLTEKDKAAARLKERYPDMDFSVLEVSATPAATDKTAPPAKSTASSSGPGFRSGSLEMGIAGLGGAYAGKKLSNFFPDYIQPELPPNPAKLALEDLLKQRQALTGGMTDYELKADALKRQVDDLAQLKLMEEEALKKARADYIAAKTSLSPKAAEEAAGRAIITPDAHTRQMQGTGSVVPTEDVTGRARLTGWRATESELKEARAAAEENLRRLQSSGLVKPGGVSVHFPGITAASPYGVLAPAQLETEFQQEVAKIAAKNIPNEQKLAELKDLYTQQKSRTGSAATGMASAEQKLLAHLNEKQAVLDPLERAVKIGEERLAGLGGEKAASVVPKAPLGAKLLAKIPGALTGAGAAISGLEAYERATQGDTIGAEIAGTGAALESLGVYPHPITRGIALVGGLGSAGLLAGYDYLRPEAMGALEKYFGYNPSVMDKKP